MRAFLLEKSKNENRSVISQKSMLPIYQSNSQCCGFVLHPLMTIDYLTWLNDVYIANQKSNPLLTTCVTSITGHWIGCAFSLITGGSCSQTELSAGLLTLISVPRRFPQTLAELLHWSM